MTGDGLLPMLRPAVRKQIALFGKGGRAVLTAIRSQDYDTLTRRPVLSKWQKGRLVLSALAAYFSCRLAMQPDTLSGESTAHDPHAHDSFDGAIAGPGAFPRLLRATHPQPRRRIFTTASSSCPSPSGRPCSRLTRTCGWSTTSPTRTMAERSTQRLDDLEAWRLQTHARRRRPRGN